MNEGLIFRRIWRIKYERDEENNNLNFFKKREEEEEQWSGKSMDCKARLPGLLIGLCHFQGGTWDVLLNLHGQGGKTRISTCILMNSKR